jgi:hypothetical protein
VTGGRDRFAAAALERLARTVAADELDVAVDDVTARVRDLRGALAVTVRTPVRVPPLAVASAEPLTERLASAGATVRTRFGALTGLVVDRVDIRATTAVLSGRRAR